MNNQQKLIEECASQFEWSYIDYQENIGMMSFKKFFADKEPLLRRVLKFMLGDHSTSRYYVRVNVYVSKMTVAVLFRGRKDMKSSQYYRNVNLQMLKNIFKDPIVYK